MAFLIDTQELKPGLVIFRRADVTIRTDNQGRKFVVLHVRRKGIYRNLVATSNVAEYLERIRAIAKAKELNDFVFTTSTGKPNTMLTVA